MKKSFTLKAFAFGAAAAVALSASATPANVSLKRALQPVKATMSDVTMADKTIGKLEYSTVDKQAKAPATVKRAEANYGAWSEEKDCQYTYTQLYQSARTVDYKYQRRDDQANPGNFQIKIKGFAKETGGQGADLILSVEKGEKDIFYIYGEPNGVNLNFQIGDGQGNSFDCYYFDHYNWMKQRQALEPTELTDEQVESWKTLSEFDPETGVGVLLPVYCPELTVETSGMAIPWYTLNADGTAIESYTLEQFRLIGPEYKNYDVKIDSDAAYFNHEKDATTGTYNLSYNMNDNTEIVFRILTGRKTGNTVQTAFNTMIEDLANGNTSDITIATEASGTVSIPVTSYRKGQYTLIIGYTNDGEKYKCTFINTLRVNDDDLKYYAAGEATYTDAMLYDGLLIFGEDIQTFGDLQQLFKDELNITLPDQYTVTVPMQANSKVPGEYRLIHPYAEYYNNYLSQTLDYDALSDYLVFNAADNSKSYILPSTSGIYFEASSGGNYMLAVGSTNKMNGGAAASADVWGTYANGVLTFPEIIIPDGAQSIDEISCALSHTQAQFDTTSGLVTYPDLAIPLTFPDICSIEGTLAGIENVKADAEFDVNAPVEYFNLQGIRVANPEAGQILIKRQGSKASKVVIR